MGVEVGLVDLALELNEKSTLKQFLLTNKNSRALKIVTFFSVYVHAKMHTHRKRVAFPFPVWVGERCHDLSPGLT